MWTVFHCVIYVCFGPLLWRRLNLAWHLSVKEHYTTRWFILRRAVGVGRAFHSWDLNETQPLKKKKKSPIYVQYHFTLFKVQTSWRSSDGSRTVARLGSTRVPPFSANSARKHLLGTNEGDYSLLFRRQQVLEAMLSEIVKYLIRHCDLVSSPCWCHDWAALRTSPINHLLFFGGGIQQMDQSCIQNCKLHDFPIILFSFFFFLNHFEFTATNTRLETTAPALLPAQTGHHATHITLTYHPGGHRSQKEGGSEWEGDTLESIGWQGQIKGLSQASQWSVKNQGWQQRGCATTKAALRQPQSHYFIHFCHEMIMKVMFFLFYKPWEE